MRTVADQKGVELFGVPETMLWTLYGRAGEALHPRSTLSDPKCVEIYRAIPYDYERSFGRAQASHAVRATVFDNAVRSFIERHPDGVVVVNLGEGLETQRFRIDDDVVWITVDLPDAIAVRERFIEPDERHLHVARSALDTRWFNAVPEGLPVLITAQGLFMYFSEEEVSSLVRSIAERWPGAELVFDHVPRWFSQRSVSEKGLWITKHYRMPPMPWGVGRSEVVPKLRAWAGEVEVIAEHIYRFPRGLRRYVFGLLATMPWTSGLAPGITHVRLGAIPK